MDSVAAPFQYIHNAPFPAKAGSVIPLLQYVQGKCSYIPEQAIAEIAKHTGVSPSHIYGVITFYAQFRLTPLGTHVIRVCDGTACHINGSEALIQELESLLQVTSGETTQDGMFTLLSVACLGCCSLAPVIMIDDETFGRLNISKLKAIIDGFRTQEGKAQ